MTEDVPESQADAAATVLARLHAAEDAARRYLVALEREAARRRDLLQAQAELDAELIRLQARREAHALLTRARVGAGLEVLTAPPPSGEVLLEAAETIDRLLEAGLSRPR